jgi:tRNA dimethylallyltransferase
MQLYAGLPILTNQPGAGDLRRAPHHLVGVWPLSHEGSVAEYAGLAAAAVDEVLARDRVAVVVGGSGLYLRAALAPLELPPAPGAERRVRYEQFYDRVGAAQAHAALLERDARAAAAVHPNDRRRVVRALELAEAGESLGGDALWTVEPPHPTRVFGLATPRAVIRERIAERTTAMFERGVEDEVRAALAGPPISSTAARIHGLQDVSALIGGEIDRAEAIARLVTRTRQYAKRQGVWMRRIPGLTIVTGADDLERALA